jgi:hypothetical protein
VRIDFEYETAYGKFADAIWFPDDEPMTPAEIEAEKQRRLADWLAVVEPPPEELSVVETPVLEE